MVIEEVLNMELRTVPLLYFLVIFVGWPHPQFSWAVCLVAGMECPISPSYTCLTYILFGVWTALTTTIQYTFEAL